MPLANAHRNLSEEIEKDTLKQFHTYILRKKRPLTTEQTAQGSPGSRHATRPR